MGLSDGFANPVANREFRVLNEIREIAQELAGDTPFSPGRTRQSALGEIAVILNNKNQPPFAALLSEPPPGELEYGSDVVGLVVMSFSVFAILHMASEDPRNSFMEPSVRALWPHTIKWAAALHPARGRLTFASDAERDRGRTVIVSSVVQVYLNLSDAEPEHIKPFLHANPDVLTQAFELWLRFHDHISPSDKSASQWAHSLTLAVGKLYELLVDGDDKATAAADRTLFVDELKCAIDGDPRVLQQAIHLQTKFLRGITISKAMRAKVWKEHFRLLLRLVCLTELWPKKISRKAITSVVSAGLYCMREDMQDSAYSAVRLVAGLCCLTGSNRPLVQSISEGVFDLVQQLEQSPDSKEYDLSDFVRHICAGFCQPRLIRTFRRLYPYPPSTAGRPPRRKPTWVDVFEVYDKYNDLYTISKNQRGWRRAMQCTNTMGPHDQMVRICACGMAYYCSGSCQRMHWHEHREECLENHGPWDLNGEISISDVVFTGDIVSWYISDHKDEIGAQLAKLNLLPKYRGGQPKQAVLHVDLTDLIPPLPTHQINIQAKPASVPGVVMVEVCLRLGNLRATRWMPFIMPLFYFGL